MYKNRKTAKERERERERERDRESCQKSQNRKSAKPERLQMWSSNFKYTQLVNDAQLRTATACDY